MILFSQNNHNHKNSYYFTCDNSIIKCPFHAFNCFFSSWSPYNQLQKIHKVKTRLRVWNKRCTSHIVVFITSKPPHNINWNLHLEYITPCSFNILNPLFFFFFAFFLHSFYPLVWENKTHTNRQYVLLFNKYSNLLIYIYNLSLFKSKKPKHQEEKQT